MNFRTTTSFPALRVPCSTKILRIGDFLWFAGTNICRSRRLKFLLGTNFCDSLFKQQNSEVEETSIFNFCCTVSILQLFTQ